MARREFETLTPQMFYILLVLNVPRHGYEIMNEVSHITEGEVNIGAGTLYTLLPRFQTEGYIDLISIEDQKKIYQLTPLGKKKLQKEKVRIEKQLTLLEAIDYEV
ncbi:MAG: helix-turn-helix transcriptional regulator [Coprobacillus sp.]